MIYSWSRLDFAFFNLMLDKIKTFLLMFVLLGSTLSNAQTKDPDVRSRQLGPDSFEIIITTSQTTDVAVAQNALVPWAKKICGDKEAEFGHYRFDAQEPVSSSSGAKTTLTLRQKIKCGVIEPQEQATSVAPIPWQPTEKEQALIERMTLAYLYEKDMKNYPIAYAMFSDSMKQAVRPESWRISAEQFNAKAGKVLSRAVSKITWYNHPPTSPTPGIFAAADYESRFENIDIHCGFVAWRKESNGFQLVREEENYIDKKSQANMKEAEIAKTKALFGCRP